MNARWINSHFRQDANCGQPRPVRVVGVYADVPARAEATRLFSRVARQCAPARDFSSSWWSFDILANARLRRIAVQAASMADMIWCSTTAVEALPKLVELWMDEWSACAPDADRALVALLRCPRGYAVEKSPALACLDQIARAHRIEFFKRAVGGEGGHDFDFDSGEVRSRFDSTLPLLDLHRPFQPRWWGINE